MFKSDYAKLLTNDGSPDCTESKANKNEPILDTFKAEEVGPSRLKECGDRISSRWRESSANITNSNLAMDLEEMEKPKEAKSKTNRVKSTQPSP